MSVATYTKTGTKATTAAKLSPEIFGLTVTNFDLLKQAYLTYQANARTVNAKTKTRTAVRGGGRKPWKQKGTGRARAGSIRSPLWRGGGVTFGPTGQENFSKHLPTRAKQQAVRQALSLAAQADKIAVIEDVVSSDGKTKAMNTLLDKVGATRRTLVVVAEKTPEILRATNNLPNVQLIRASYLNVCVILDSDIIIVSKPALEVINTWLGADRA